MDRRRVVRILKWAIALAGGVLAMELALMAYPPLAGWAFWLISPGKTQCGAVELARSVTYHKEWVDAGNRILASARMVRQDGDLQLWDVPGMRQFWIRGSMGKLNALAFAEQAAGQYWHPSIHIRPGDIVLDVGADFGSVASQALRAGAAQVVAIEIAPDKWRCLERTFAKEIAEGRVTLVRTGAWDRESTLELRDDSVVLGRDGGKQVVRVTTIDRIVAELQLSRVDFISMDIEGAEKPALRGAAETLRKYRPRMAIAAEHLPDDAVAIPQTVRTILPGYEVICGRCEAVDRRFVAQVLWFR